MSNRTLTAAAKANIVFVPLDKLKKSRQRHWWVILRIARRLAGSPVFVKM